MRPISCIALMAVLLSGASPSGFSQLRNLSEYSQDCIVPDKTYFVLHDAGAADFGWTSQWTHTTANAYPDKKAMYIWKFKDGLKAYSQQADFIVGDLGQATGYVATGQSTTLEDVHRKKLQPITAANYPVEVELWIGEIDDSAGYAPENLLDRVCFNAQSIRPNEANRFSRCK
ncbi:MAG TPA: hypothetical protein VMG30_09175 [Acidobacteriota bacterium]|nr:hypothetical protein [Acidobacteriota bacterium]